MERRQLSVRRLALLAIPFSPQNREKVLAILRKYTKVDPKYLRELTLSMPINCQGEETVNWKLAEAPVVQIPELPAPPWPRPFFIFFF